MTENYDEEQILKNRILLREATIRKLTTKYLELIYKFNTLTRNEMAQLIKEILNELDLIEIAILKAENLERLSIIDKGFYNVLADEIDYKVNEVREDIQSCDSKLLQAKKEKEYKINCEDVSKIINKYDEKEKLKETISQLKDENSNLGSRQKFIMDKLNSQSSKLSLLVKLVNDLKYNFEEELKDDNKMIID